MLTYEQVSEFLNSAEWIQSKRNENKSKNSHLVDMSVTIVSGATAGVMSWILVIPFDVLKTSMQVESDPDKYKSLRNCLETSTNVKLLVILSHYFQVSS